MTSAHDPRRPYNQWLGGQDAMMAKRVVRSLILVAAITILASREPPSHADPTGPSVNCARATSAVNRMVCGSSELRSADRKLAADFEATSLQAGIDAKQLAAGEAVWLQTVRNRCSTASCLLEAYRQRDAAILDISLRAASPAAYADTRPFPSSSSALSMARSLLGMRCNEALDQRSRIVRPIDGFEPIVDAEGYVRPLNVAGERFAFLASGPDQDSQCVVSDLVALPPAHRGDTFLQCHMSDQTRGFAIRQSSGKTIAYWAIDEKNRRLVREPIHVLGEQDLRCQQPETGE
jgi:uncharacterized protein